MLSELVTELASELFDDESGLVIEDTGSILTGSLFDLIESVLGDWVESFGGNSGLYGGNWEVVGLGLVSSVIGDECKLEGFTVGEGECYGSLRLGRGTTSGAGLGDSDAVAGFEVGAECTVGGWVGTGRADDVGDVFSGFVGAGGGQGQKGGEDDLRKKGNLLHTEKSFLVFARSTGIRSNIVYSELGNVNDKYLL